MITGLFILSFIITPAGFFGTTTTGDTFSQITLSEHLDVFRLNEKPIWYVCNGKVVEELKDVSICLNEI